MRFKLPNTDVADNMLGEIGLTLCGTGGNNFGIIPTALPPGYPTDPARKNAPLTLATLYSDGCLTLCNSSRSEIRKYHDMIKTHFASFEETAAPEAP